MVPAPRRSGYTAGVRSLVATLALLYGCGGPREPDEVPTTPPETVAVQPVDPESAPESKVNPEPEAPAVTPEPAPRADVPERARVVASSARPGLLAFADAFESEGSLWVGQLAGNGGRDVVIFVPPGIRPEASFDLVVHFHGTYSENIAEPTNGVPKKEWVGWDRLLQTIEAVTELDCFYS